MLSSPLKALAKKVKKVKKINERKGNSAKVRPPNGNTINILDENVSFDMEYTGTEGVNLLIVPFEGKYTEVEKNTTPSEIEQAKLVFSDVYGNGNFNPNKPPCNEEQYETLRKGLMRRRTTLLDEISEMRLADKTNNITYDALVNRQRKMGEIVNILDTNFKYNRMNCEAYSDTRFVHDMKNQSIDEAGLNSYYDTFSYLVLYNLYNDVWDDQNEKLALKNDGMKIMEILKRRNKSREDVTGKISTLQGKFQMNSPRYRQMEVFKQFYNKDCTTLVYNSINNILNDQPDKPVLKKNNLDEYIKNLVGFFK